MSRPFNKHESDRLTFQVPKELKCKLKEELSPIVKEKVRKWKKEQSRK